MRRRWSRSSRGIRNRLTKQWAHGWAMESGAETTGGAGAALIFEVDDLGTAATPMAVLSNGVYRGTFPACISRIANLNTTDPKIIVFKRGGTIALTGGALTISGSDYDNLTIAGWTAPGDGIAIVGRPVSISQVDNLIIGGISFGCPQTTGAAQDNDMVTVQTCTNVLFDHCDFYWAVDECSSVGNQTPATGTNNVTFQYCSFFEGLRHGGHSEGQHSMGSQNGNPNLSGVNKISYHNCLWAHHGARSPQFAGGGTSGCDVRGNVVYNWGILGCTSADTGSAGGKMNVVGNLFDWTDDTDPGDPDAVTQNNPIVVENVSAACVYLKDNVWSGSTTQTGMIADASSGIDNSPTETTITAVVSATPFGSPPPVPVLSAADLKTSLLPIVGHLPQIAELTTVIADVNANTGYFGKPTRFNFPPPPTNHTEVSAGTGNVEAGVHKYKWAYSWNGSVGPMSQTDYTVDITGTGPSNIRVDYPDSNPTGSAVNYALYRTTAGGATYLLVESDCRGNSANATYYTDSTPDASLGAEGTASAFPSLPATLSTVDHTDTDNDAIPDVWETASGGSYETYALLARKNRILQATGQAGVDVSYA